MAAFASINGHAQRIAAGNDLIGIMELIVQNQEGTAELELSNDLQKAFVALQSSRQLTALLTLRHLIEEGLANDLFDAIQNSGMDADGVDRVASHLRILGFGNTSRELDAGTAGMLPRNATDLIGIIKSATIDTRSATAALFDQYVDNLRRRLAASTRHEDSGASSPSNLNSPSQSTDMSIAGSSSTTARSLQSPTAMSKSQRSIRVTMYGCHWCRCCCCSSTFVCRSVFPVPSGARLLLPAPPNDSDGDSGSTSQSSSLRSQIVSSDGNHRTPAAGLSPSLGNENIVEGMSSMFLAEAEPTGPSPMQKWNEEWTQTLQARKDEENSTKAAMIEKAREDLEAFQKKREMAREKRMSKNREDEQAKLEAIEADLDIGNSWQRVCKMVELSQDSAGNSEDTKRMRDILILLNNDASKAQSAGRTDDN